MVIHLHAEVSVTDKQLCEAFFENILLLLLLLLLLFLLYTFVLITLAEMRRRFHLPD